MGVDILAAVLILLLVMAAVFFQIRYVRIKGEFYKFQQGVVMANQNQAVLDFTQAFVDEVLNASGEIDFETRLNLEGAVRALNDEQILSAWQAFTSAQTESQAQTALTKLLSVLIRKSR